MIGIKQNLLSCREPVVGENRQKRFLRNSSGSSKAEDALAFRLQRLSTLRASAILRLSNEPQNIGWYRDLLAPIDTIVSIGAYFILRTFKEDF